VFKIELGVLYILLKLFDLVLFNCLFVVVLKILEEGAAVHHLDSDWPEIELFLLSLWVHLGFWL
jgi:hypothetical protein